MKTVRELRMELYDEDPDAFVKIQIWHVDEQRYLEGDQLEALPYEFNLVYSDEPPGD